MTRGEAIYARARATIEDPKRADDATYYAIWIVQPLGRTDMTPIIDCLAQRRIDPDYDKAVLDLVIYAIHWRG